LKLSVLSSVSCCLDLVATQLYTYLKLFILAGVGTMELCEFSDVPRYILSYLQQWTIKPLFQAAFNIKICKNLELLLKEIKLKLTTIQDILD
jgi:hypothetical protein